MEELTPSYLSELGEDIANREKLFIPRCITWEGQSPKVDRVFIRIESQDKPMKRYMGPDGNPNFFIVIILNVDNPTLPYEISWTNEGSSKIHREDETFLEEKTSDEAIEEFDTIEKATIAMDLMYKKLFPVDAQEKAVFLKKFSSERVNEIVVWNHTNKKGIGRLHEAEIKHVNFRIEHAADPLRDWLAKQLNVEKNSVNVKVPRIALCASGGGLRASVGTRFFVDQLQKEGFLPAISYMSTLSGSTWFMTDWLVNKVLVPPGDPWIVNTRDVLGSSKSNSLYIGSTLAWHNSRASNLYTLSSWFIELWANVIGHGYLSLEKEWDPNLTRFSNLLPFLSTPLGMSTYPWPLMTSVGESEFDWFEFSPTQIGRLSIGSPQWSWIEPSAFGCKVTAEGKKVDSPPGDELGQLMATWGSAVTLELNDLQKYVGGYGYFGKIWSKLSRQKYLCPPFECPSWENPTQKIIFRDAGLGINVPYPPVVEPERNVEILISLDISADCWDNPAGTLDLFSQWIHNKKHPKFPAAAVTPRDPRFQYKSEEDKTRLRQAEIYDLNGVVVVYLPISIQNAENRVSTYNMKHDPEAQKLIYDTVMEKWNSIKVRLAEYIKKHYSLG